MTYDVIATVGRIIDKLMRPTNKKAISTWWGETPNG